MTTLSAAQVAALVKQAGFPAEVHVTMVAIARAESGFNTEAVNSADPYGGSFGLFQINGAHQLDNRRLLSDPQYNTEAAKRIYDSQGLRAWGVYTSGAYEQYLNEARQAVAQAASVTGNPVLPGGSTTTPSQPAITYGDPGPEFTDAGRGKPLRAAEETNAPLSGLRIQGTEIQGDFSAVVIGSPTFTAGIETIPNVTLTIADPEGDLLFQAANLWEPGVIVQYEDLYLRVDTIVFEPGSHTTGQLTITCVDDIVYALMNLKGPRTAQGLSATEWIAQELDLAGIDASKYFLGESVPTQSVIARDEADQSGQGGQGEDPSAWTTAVRLARELGKRLFISGRRLVFGSAAFAMQWTATAPLRLTRHADDLPEGEHWIDLPTARRTGVGDRSDVVEVSGRVPLSRAKFFRPGVPVDVTRTPAVAAGEYQHFMCSSVTFELGVDVTGADVTLLEPVDPPPQPPQVPTAEGVNAGDTSSGSAVSGGGADGQVDQFVALALQQAGKQYIYGAQPSASDPDPRAFDCSALVQWAATRVGIGGITRTTDTQEAQCRAAGTLISVADAINTKGALLFQPGHVAISLGNGNTIEAMNPSQGVRQGNAAGRGFTVGGKLPGAQGYR